MLIMSFNVHDINTSDWIQIIIAIITLFGIIVSVVISIKTLNQNNKLLEDNTRPYVEIYKELIDITSIIEYIVIKNFGNSTAHITNFSFDKKLLKLTITKNLEQNKTNIELIKSLEYLKEATLAPGQLYKIPINTKDFDIDKVEFKIQYRNANKIYNETKTLYLKQDFYVTINKQGENIYKNCNNKSRDIMQALSYISNSLQEIIRKM